MKNYKKELEEEIQLITHRVDILQIVQQQSREYHRKIKLWLGIITTEAGIISVSIGTYGIHVYFNAVVKCLLPSCSLLEIPPPNWAYTSTILGFTAILFGLIFTISNLKY